MPVEHVETRAGSYADSVTLMQVSTRVTAAAGVERAMVAMGTALNLDLLTGMGFALPPGSGPNDLVVAVRAEDEAALALALETVAGALAARPVTGSFATSPPRTVGAALRERDRAIALVSVPGPHAFAEAMDALDADTDVMIFSDNVPVEQEIRLKDVAAERGLLVLGPDCGTAVVAGIGLGFSHTLRPGPVGIVAASGTGAQQVLCLLDAAGVGVSAALGVGGRDLSAAVGARSTLAAMSALDSDPGTDLIVVISKPPAAAVAEAVRAHAATLGTPVRLALLGPGNPDLTAATEQVLTDLGVAVPDWPALPGRPPAGDGTALVGLFSGGTLCDEAMLIAADRLGPIASNIPLRPEDRTDPRAPWDGRHVMIDFGDDELTAGRPHPMIDPSLRTERLAAAGADPRTRVVLLDVVLGHGAHPDPAGELAPVIAALDGPAVVACVVGAERDPQDRRAQMRVLHEAGAHVFTSNAAAARYACDLIEAR